MVARISGVKNGVDFLANDIKEINTDLDSGHSLPIIDLFVKTTIDEVATLRVDAS